MAKKAYISVDGKARKIKKGYVSVENFIPRELPEGYTQVEYIESTGTQYIDIGIKADSSKIRIVLDWMYTSDPSDDTILGSQASSTYSLIPYAYSSNILAFYVGKTGGLSRRTVSKNTRYLLDATANSGTLTATLNGQSETVSYTTPLESANNIYLFANNNGGSPIQNTKARLYKCLIYKDDVLVRDLVPCVYYGTPGLYDMVNGHFYTNDASGTNFDYGSVHGDWARLIKKAYISIGGVARPFWGGGELTYYGSITALSANQINLSATAVGNYALFAGGGVASSNLSSVVNTYNKSLTRNTATALSTARHSMAATSVGNYALFGGGYTGSCVSTVDVYDTSLTHTNPSSALRNVAMNLAATTVGGYALFGGGAGTSGGTFRVTVTAYNSSLTRSSPTDLTLARYAFYATTVGNYAIFGPGNSGTATQSESAITFDAYNASLTKMTIAQSSLTHYNAVATAVGNYAVFAGGYYPYNGIRCTTLVEAFDTSLTKTTPTALSTGRNEHAATSLDGYALFGGGNTSANSDPTNSTEAYDENLTKIIPTAMGAARLRLAATTIGNYALFAGGGTANNNSGAKSSAYAYTIV